MNIGNLTLGNAIAITNPGVCLFCDVDEYAKFAFIIMEATCVLNNIIE